MTLSHQAINRESGEVPYQIAQEIESWQRILAGSKPSARESNLRNAALELRRRGKADPTVYEAIEHSLAEMASGVGIDLKEAVEAQIERESPIPLIPEKSQGAPFPVAATGPLAKAINAIARKVQAPDSIAAQSVLAVHNTL
ncbi:hypothetical protein ACO2JO_13270 [Leptospira interrogans]